MSEMTKEEAQKFLDDLPPRGQTLTFESFQAQKNFYSKLREAANVMEKVRVRTAIETLRKDLPIQGEPVRYPISRLLPYCSHSGTPHRQPCMFCGAPAGAPLGNIDPVTHLYIDPRTPVRCPVPLCRWLAYPEPQPAYGVYYQINVHLENHHPLYSWFKNLRKPKQVSK